MAISMLKIRRPLGRLIFNMGIAIPDSEELETYEVIDPRLREEENFYHGGDMDDEDITQAWLDEHGIQNLVCPEVADTNGVSAPNLPPRNPPAIVPRGPQGRKKSDTTPANGSPPKTRPKPSLPARQHSDDHDPSEPPPPIRSELKSPQFAIGQNDVLNQKMNLKKTPIIPDNRPANPAIDASILLNQLRKLKKTSRDETQEPPSPTNNTQDLRHILKHVEPEPEPKEPAVPKVPSSRPPVPIPEEPPSRPPVPIPDDPPARPPVPVPDAPVATADEPPSLPPRPNDSSPRKPPRALPTNGEETKTKPVPQLPRSIQNMPLPPVPSPEDKQPAEQDGEPRTKEDKKLYGYRWYCPSISSANAEENLRKTGQTGSFLVRRSRNNQGNPFTLLLIFEGNLFKLAIRRRDDGKLALGKESSGGEITFRTVPELVSYYSDTPVQLRSARGLPEGHTALRQPPS